MKKSRLVALVTAVMAVAALSFAAGCGSSDDNSSGSGLDSELVKAGTLTVGSDIPYPPFEFGDPPGYKGFDIDLVNEVAKRMGIENVAIKPTSFDTIFTSVAQGKFDLVASAATITKEREQTVKFSQPYYESEQALLVPDGSDIKTVDQLEGKNVAVQDGTTGKDFAENETGASQVRGFPNGPAAIAALKAGQVDATIIDRPVAEDAVAKGQTGFEIASVIPTGEFYGFAMAKDTPELEKAVNKALSEIKEDGTLNKLYQQWFKVDAPKSLMEHTTSEGVAID
ncbi:MAG: basic amino acid ABC transporter substrate-binding protein [Solirubrobacterales bacterium]|nr:basic amino acid ABC transporter substrate-binding protein [Solirubrobacterales bacterium]